MELRGSSRRSWVAGTSSGTSSGNRPGGWERAAAHENADGTVNAVLTRLAELEVPIAPRHIRPV
jgi:hypothetical protein